MTDTRWLSEGEQRAWREYLAMNAQLGTRLNRQLQADVGLSLADFEVLVRLTDRADGRVRAFELARALQWEKSRLSHHLARMQRRGLVARQDCPEDARGAFVVLTAEGRRAVEQAAPRHVETVRELFFDQITAEQVEMLAAISSQVLARLEDTDTTPGGTPSRPGAARPRPACPNEGGAHRSDLTRAKPPPQAQ